MKIQFTIEIEVERVQGKFASKDEIAEAIADMLEGANEGSIDGVGADGESTVQAEAIPPDELLRIVDEAIRDEGTSLHYLAPGARVRGDEALAAEIARELLTLPIPSRRGLAWTTDAPYRETRERIAAHAAEGALAVEMQAASLFAFAAARGARVGVVAHVTNAVDAEHEPFHKGPDDLDELVLFAMCRAAHRLL
jgi:uridine phosphorylase